MCQTTLASRMTHFNAAYDHVQETSLWLCHYTVEAKLFGNVGDGLVDLVMQVLKEIIRRDF